MSTSPLPPPFTDPDVTARGERRAAVVLGGLRTLWFNTGTLCNIACKGCYIESSPRNDRLAYLTRDEVRAFLCEAAADFPLLEEIGFTGGEPFMNPAFPAMLDDALSAGYQVLVLTNAMRPMQRRQAELAALAARFDTRLRLRVSLDHYTAAGHEQIRGTATWAPALQGLEWLAARRIPVTVAARLLWHETETAVRSGFAGLFGAHALPIDAADPHQLVLFPEMEAQAQVPEITESCWGILGKSPQSVMCASSRMVVKHRGASAPSVIACTLLPHEPGFDMGTTLAQASGPVKLNHRHCARFCVLGGASCSG